MDCFGRENVLYARFLLSQTHQEGNKCTKAKKKLTSYASNHTFKCLYEYPNKQIEIQRPNIFHLKAFGMMNLHYEIRICQEIYNRIITNNKSKC